MTSIGSDIRLLPVGQTAILAHCTLPAGKVSKPIVHRAVEEIWYCLSGEGEVWRGTDDCEVIVPFHTDTSLTIPTGTRFQFRYLFSVKTYPAGAEPGL